MATLEQFLRTGQLGPLALGMTTADVTAVLGEPQQVSRKSNPLLVKYGGLQLTFSRQRADRVFRMNQLGIYFQPEPEPLPASVRPEDIPPGVAPSEREFRAFL